VARTKRKKNISSPAPHTLSKKEKEILCRVLFTLKVPDGYSSNPINNVSMKDLKLHSMKSHDCHVLMQQILPIALRHVLPKAVRNTICRLCFIYRRICEKMVDPIDLDNLQVDVVENLCLLEKYSPPSLFDITMHLIVHLVQELRYGGPVVYQWMYPFERSVKFY